MGKKKKKLCYSVVRPSKQPLMVRTFLKVYMELGFYFLFLQEQIKDIIIMCVHACACVCACGVCTCAYACVGMCVRAKDRKWNFQLMTHVFLSLSLSLALSLCVIDGTRRR
jgi:hypothetical protein